MKRFLFLIILVLNLNNANGQVNQFEEIVNHYNKEMNFNGVVLHCYERKN